VQEVHAVEAAWEKFPAGHKTGAAADVAQNEPAGHVEQFTAPTEHEVIAEQTLLVEQIMLPTTHTVPTGWGPHPKAVHTMDPAA